MENNDSLPIPFRPMGTTTLGNQARLTIQSLVTNPKKAVNDLIPSHPNTIVFDDDIILFI